nr:MAG TPA: Protein of unknown function (DUF717) [Caudoviricetes sp.]
MSCLSFFSYPIPKLNTVKTVFIACCVLIRRVAINNAVIGYL